MKELKIENKIIKSFHSISTNKYNLIVTTNVQPQHKTQVMQATIRNSNEFLDKVSEMDSVLPYYNYQVSLFKEGINPDWYRTQNGKETGHFVIFFSTNIHAFRAFCILSVDWMNRQIDFFENIEGILVAIKAHYWYLQIWVDDGFTSSKIINRYYTLIGFLRDTIGIADSTLYQIGFQTHPQKTNNTNSNAKVHAITIPTFQECLKNMAGEQFSDEKEDVAQFDLSVVNIHKRSRKERRLNPSYVDNVKNT